MKFTLMKAQKILKIGQSGNLKLKLTSLRFRRMDLSKPVQRNAM